MNAAIPAVFPAHAGIQCVERRATTLDELR